MVLQTPKEVCEFYKTSLHPKTKVIKGILQEESAKLLTQFFIEKRNLN